MVVEEGWTVKMEIEIGFRIGIEILNCWLCIEDSCMMVDWWTGWLGSIACMFYWNVKGLNSTNKWHSLPYILNFSDDTIRSVKAN